MNKVYKTFQKFVLVSKYCSHAKEALQYVGTHGGTYKSYRGFVVALGLSGAVVLNQVKQSKSPNDLKSKMEFLAMKIQSDVCRMLEEIIVPEEDEKFVEMSSEKGVTLCYTEDGFILEKAILEVVVKEAQPGAHVVGLFASIYPKNPNIPSLQFNLVYSEDDQSSNPDTDGSLSGSILLLPFVYNEEDFKNYHDTLKKICDRHNRNHYHRFKSLMDTNSKLNGESLGVGGIAFPDESINRKEISFKFVEALQAIFPLYIQLIQKHKHDTYTIDDRWWQQVERGRHAYHSITQTEAQVNHGYQNNFKLHLPPFTKWPVAPLEVGAKQKKLVEVLKNPKEWA